VALTSLSRTTKALTRYRVMAWVTGAMLLVLVLVAMPLKYWADSTTLISIVGPLHGFLYIGYVISAIDLAARRRWPVLRTLGVLLAGIVPFATFYAEHRVWQSEHAALEQG
jgi:integral membrane protein